VSATQRNARVVQRRALSVRVSELVLEIAGAPPFRWRAGQYLTLHPAGGNGAHEGPLAYSIASAWDGTDPPRLALAIGPGSGAEVLAPIGAGASLDIDGPFGSFTLPAAPGALLVGAGTGVAPLRAHVGEWLGRRDAGPVILLVGARTEADLLWHDELGLRGASDARFHYEPALSQPSATWAGRTGYVQAHLPEVVTRLPSGFLVRVCGSTSMVETCLSALRALGVEDARLEAESY
jgi:CDP-4-dehydro-6-deoxyglucose reductase, E3